MILAYFQFLEEKDGCGKYPRVILGENQIDHRSGQFDKIELRSIIKTGKCFACLLRSIHLFYLQESPLSHLKHTFVRERRVRVTQRLAIQPHSILLDQPAPLTA